MQRFFTRTVGDKKNIVGFQKDRWSFTGKNLVEVNRSFFRTAGYRLKDAGFAAFCIRSQSLSERNRLQDRNVFIRLQKETSRLVKLANHIEKSSSGHFDGIAWVDHHVCAGIA